MANLNPDTVLLELQPIFEEALEAPGLKITRNSNATNTPDWDSLAHISIIEMVEGHFKIHFALGELQEMKEVGDMVDMIVAKSSREN